MSLSFRWLGVAGVELNAGGQVLAIDPFFTRPSWRGLLKPVSPNATLAAKKLPACSAVLVTHSHFDHLMDVPAVLRHTGAVAYGSENTYQLLKLHGIPDRQICKVDAGQTLVIGNFSIQVINGRHSWIPFSRVFNGRLRKGLKPPLRLQDYRMDTCLGYHITCSGMQVLICAAEPQPADVLFAVAQEPKEYYLRLLKGTHPKMFIPIHWDFFLQPFDKPMRKLTRPGRMSLNQLSEFAQEIVPGLRVLIPEMFVEYSLG